MDLRLVYFFRKRWSSVEYQFSIEYRLVDFNKPDCTTTGRTNDPLATDKNVWRQLGTCHVFLCTFFLSLQWIVHVRSVVYSIPVVMLHFTHRCRNCIVCWLGWQRWLHSTLPPFKICALLWSKLSAIIKYV